MLNQSIVVGRLVDRPIIEESGDRQKVATPTLAVPRSFKNSEGVYDTDFIECLVWNNIAVQVKEYCNKGDVMGVKGRLQKLSGDPLQLVAEKVTFLSSNKNNESAKN